MQNFGQIHETFKDILVNGIVEGKNEYKKIFKVYSKALKENSILKTQFNVFDKLENKVSISGENEKSHLFVDECISILQNLDKVKVNEINNKLVRFLNKKGFKLSENYENKVLHEHIHNLAFNKKISLNNIESIVESRLFLNNFSKKSENKNLNETIEPYINTFVGPVMVEKFNSKYIDKLTENEKQTFKIIYNGSDVEKESFYKNSIVECIDLVNVKLNEECSIDEKDTYLRVKDKLLRYSYSPNTFIDEITNITYLKDTLK